MKWQAKHSSLIAIAVGFATMYFILKKEWMLIPIGISLIGFLLSSVGNFVHIIWVQVAKVLGYINSRVLLFILFFLILTPLALIRKLFQPKPATLHSAKSFFITRDHLYTKKNLQDPW